MATVIQDGTTEDLIRAFQQMACAEGHLKTLIEKYQSELQNGLIDVNDKDICDQQVEKLNDATDELNDIAELRRAVMLRIMSGYTGADKNYWCVVKHLAVASYCAFEAYQASDNDAELMNIWLDTDARFVKAMTRWLGTAITSCAACFADILKGERNDGI